MHEIDWVVFLFWKIFFLAFFRIPRWERCFFLLLLSLSRARIFSSTLFCFSYKDVRTAANMLFVFLRVLWKTRSSDQMISAYALTCFDSSTLSFFCGKHDVFSFFDRHCNDNEAKRIKRKGLHIDSFVLVRNPTQTKRWFRLFRNTLWHWIISLSFSF